MCRIQDNSKNQLVKPFRCRHKRNVRAHWGLYSRLYYLLHRRLMTGTLSLRGRRLTKKRRRSSHQRHLIYQRQNHREWPARTAHEANLRPTPLQHLAILLPLHGHRKESPSPRREPKARLALQLQVPAERLQMARKRVLQQRLQRAAASQLRRRRRSWENLTKTW